MDCIIAVVVGFVIGVGCALFISGQPEDETEKLEQALREAEKKENDDN